MFQKRESIGKFLIYDWMVGMATKRNFNQRIIYWKNKSENQLFFLCVCA